MNKELEQVKQALENVSKLRDGIDNHTNASLCQWVCVAGRDAKTALTALEAYEARLESEEAKERSFYITYQYTAPNAIVTGSAAVHNVQGVLTYEVIKSWAEQLEKGQGYKNCNIIFYKKLEKQPLKQ